MACPCPRYVSSVDVVGWVPSLCVRVRPRSDCALSFKIEAVVEEELAGMDLDNDGIIEYHELKAYQARKVTYLRVSVNARACASE